MVGDHDGNVAPLLPLAARFGDAFPGIEQGFHGGCAEDANGFGLDGHELAVEELAADFHFVGLRGTIFGRAAFDDVADVDVIAFELDAFFGGGVLNHLREQLASAADEGQALLIFIGTRTFANEDERRSFVAGAKDDFVAGLAEAAAFAIADVFADFR